ncbi:MAG: PASTA domain-containing protein [Deltaproteobacteria bacterium]|nr:MAG: PASTA domain-containing protein [Deltaproteobacteria bacterium]
MKRETGKRKNYAPYIIILAILISGSGILLARAFHADEQDKKNPGHGHTPEPALSLAPYRGGIFDRSYRELAVTATAYSVYAHPLDVDDPAQTAAALSNTLRINEKDLLKMLECEKAFVWIAHRVASHQAETIKNLKLKGIHFINENCRLYPRNSLAAQIIGFADTDGHGIEGLESAYDDLLCSTPLSLQKKCDESTRLTFNGGVTEVNAGKGNNIILTLDSNIQAVAERGFCPAPAKDNIVKAGAVIVMDIKSGAVLAMANYPSYNLNTFWEANASLRRNRAVTDIYELGELARFFGAAAAIEEQTLREKSSVPAMQGRDNETHVSHGDTKDNEKNLSESPHTPSPEFLYNFLLKLGFGNKTGICLPAENSGTLPPYSQYKGDISAFYQGEGITVTPLQLITAFGAILNHGVFMPPHVVSKVTDSEGNLIKEYQCAPARQACTPETSEKISAILRNQQGKEDKNFILLTACNHVRPPAGLSSPDHPSLDNSSRVDYIKYLLGGVPADNPKVAILMIIEGAPGEEESRTKIERRIKDIAYASLRVLTRPRPKALSSYREKKDRGYAGRENKAQNSCRQAAATATKAMVMPNVRGKSMREALYLLQGYDVSLVVTGSGVAVCQSPAPGTRLRKNSRCVIEFKPSS